ncbi:MAG TPA: nucleoside hydrolase [Bacillota bacterium]|nr:nucleoside hydrolase [Candidatus Fermentithermobacillaceae bacterium]HOB30877.1 nucleoside hydrolase [Bacillota bacterium]HOK64674.1 nucleoside hydrolase [Bacillota bacterium]HOL12195.1 nucleoside hydrolase [Bacillota bacterium]HOQ02233.1 nucleoside hydrolase [Bacillota bacterium]
MRDGKIPVIIDCDPGHDDAVALALAFGSGQFDVKGVTTVAGNSTVDNTYANALKFLSFIGVCVEVAKGAAKPLLRQLTVAPNVHGTTGLDGTDLGDSRLKGSGRSAVELLTEILRTSSEKITLIPTGPLTNIATLFLAAPEVKENVEQIVLMGGAALEGNWTPAAEFNIFVDPEAARIVFESGVPITMVGLDVTHKALIYPDEIEALRKQGRIGKAIAELMDFYGIFYRKQFKGNPVHDAVAVAAVMCPDIISTQHLNVSVETCGEFTRGMTVVDFRGVTGKDPNCNVALGLDRESFIDLIFDAVRKLDESGAV